jgi:hypothetical protein
MSASLKPLGQLKCSMHPTLDIAPNEQNVYIACYACKLCMYACMHVCMYACMHISDCRVLSHRVSGAVGEERRQETSLLYDSISEVHPACATPVSIVSTCKHIDCLWFVGHLLICSRRLRLISGEKSATIYRATLRSRCCRRTELTLGKVTISRTRCTLVD